MKNFFLTLAICFLTNDCLAGDIQFLNANLKCFDGATEIGIYNPEKVQIESGDGFSLDQAAKQKIKIKIRHQGQIYEFANQTIAIQDGFGNTRYNTIAMDLRAGGNSMDVFVLMSLDYDHESGFLSGHFAIEIPPKEEFQSKSYVTIPLKADTMNCYDYTFGDRK
jgi:hypothetical protein